VTNPFVPTAHSVKIYPLTPERWADFEKLFGKNGACAGCWCMWWRLPRSQWQAQKGESNKRAFRQVVKNGPPPGLLAYVRGDPAGWCAVGPREDYSGLTRSRVLKPVDDQPVWSVTCFFVARGFRRRGLTVRLFEGAAQFAKKSGARVLEGYPIEPRKDQPDAFVYTGLASAFHKAGFTEVARRSATRPIFRLQLAGSPRIPRTRTER
jgi:GNAT superfamily N-acetyltransferase